VYHSKLCKEHGSSEGSSEGAPNASAPSSPSNTESDDSVHDAGSEDSLLVAHAQVGEPNVAISELSHGATSVLFILLTLGGQFFGTHSVMRLRGIISCQLPIAA
jgi:hypothetical protein